MYIFGAFPTPKSVGRVVRYIFFAKNKKGCHFHP
jgi:hypothetical protein